MATRASLARSRIAFISSAIRTRMFEGALIAAWAVEAERIYLYMRDEYPAVLHIFAHEIAALEKAGIIDKGMIGVARRWRLYLR